jgi:hypothetical protein
MQPAILDSLGAGFDNHRGPKMKPLHRNSLIATFFALGVACGDDGGTGTSDSTSGSTGETTGASMSSTTTNTTTTNGTSSTTTNGTTMTTSQPTTDTSATDTTATDGDTTSNGTTGNADTGSTGAEDTGTGTGGMAVCQDPPADQCEDCACMSCEMELQDCADDEGCTAIRDCAEMAMCSGLDCLGPCGGVINMYGGLAGASAGLAQALGDCISASCPKCLD